MEEAVVRAPVVWDNSSDYLGAAAGDGGSSVSQRDGGMVLDARASWVSDRPEPRVAEVAGDVGSHSLRGEQSARVSSYGGTPDIEAQWQAFRQGYRDFGGQPEWEEHFVNDVIPCESRGYSWASSYELYVSRAQFHPDSWRRSSANTGLYDPTNAYHVGANVAWWSNAIEHPGGTGGWPYCWTVGTIPP